MAPSTAGQKVCVILGAGASHDVHGPGSALLNPDFRPPLANELFDLAKHLPYRQILTHYPAADHLALQLTAPSQSKDFDLEGELRRFARHHNSQTRKNFNQIPPYIRDLLFKCSREYTAVPYGYSLLVQQIIAESECDTLFLTLNYDDLLEKAIQQFNGTWVFSDMAHYIDVTRTAKVVKFHGSINWFARLRPAKLDWRQQVAELDINEMAEKAQRGDIEIRDTQHAFHETGFYPVLTAPLAGKGLADAVCPAEHLEVAKEFLATCKKFLIIGTGGLDDDLMEFLDQSVPVGSSIFGDVVDPNAVVVMDRFKAGVRAFRQEGGVSHIRPQTTSFQTYLSDTGIQSFMKWQN